MNFTENDTPYLAFQPRWVQVILELANAGFLTAVTVAKKVHSHSLAFF